MIMMSWWVEDDTNTPKPNTYDDTDIDYDDPTVDEHTLS